MTPAWRQTPVPLPVVKGGNTDGEDDEKTGGCDGQVDDDDTDTDNDNDNDENGGEDGIPSGQDTTTVDCASLPALPRPFVTLDHIPSTEDFHLRPGRLSRRCHIREKLADSRALQRTVRGVDSQRRQRWRRTDGYLDPRQSTSGGRRPSRRGPGVQRASCG